MTEATVAKSIAKSKETWQEPETTQTQEKAISPLPLLSMEEITHTRKRQKPQVPLVQALIQCPECTFMPLAKCSTHSPYLPGGLLGSMRHTASQ